MADGLNNFFQSLGGKLGSAIGNPQTGQKPGIPIGPVRTPFLTPKTLLSSVYVSSGISRYQLTENKKTGQSFQQQPGFVPIEYYRVPTGEFRIVPPENLRSFYDAERDFMLAPGKIGDDRMSDFVFKYSDYVSIIAEKNELETSDGGTGIKPWEKTDVMNNRFLGLPDGGGTPTDNEDPVYFGFEVIINVNTSPLFNGELEKFIDRIGSNYSEVGARKDILRQFQFEMQKYFKFDSTLTAVGGRTEEYLGTSSIPEPNNLKRYYVKKLSGLNLLVESNTGNVRKSFVDYGKDLIKITFYEDTTLNLGRLASYYKLLYWSRLRGKSIIPENLLRFDCEIIVSELRNFVKVRKSNNMLEVLKSNLSRYRYQVYECQLWFNKMSHPEDIDMSSPPTITDTYDVEMTFKYSTMVYEQYEGQDLQLRNSTVDPLSRTQGDIPVEETNREYIPFSKLNERPVDVSLKEIFTVNMGSEVDANTSEDVTISNLQEQSKFNIYRLINSQNPISDIEPSTKKEIYGKGAEQLLENLKNSALRESQRQLNVQFRLLNNSIDSIRNSFGIGRMPAPTNVYFPTQNTGPYGNSTVFFDVQNSLRNFAGDTLTGLIGGG